MNDISETIHVAIVDDHFAIRNGYKTVLKSFPYVKEISLFSKASDLLEKIRVAEVPDINFVLLDIELENENGLDVCKYLKLHYKTVRVLMISSYHSEEFIVQSEQYNADGYLFKNADPQEVRRAFDLIVLNKQRYYPTEAKEKIFDYERRMKRAAESPKIELTYRELQILRLVCDGHSTKQIAKILGREATTIDKHRQNIMKKIGIHRGVEILHYAIEHGLYIQKARK